MVNDVTRKELIPDGCYFLVRAFQPFHHSFPVLQGSNRAEGCLTTGLTIENNSIEILIFHAEAFREPLARRLILRADDDPAKIEEDCANAHLLFFDVPLAADFFDGPVWREAGL